MIGHRVVPVIAALAILGMTGCSKPGRIVDGFHRNQPPATELTYGPAESTTTVYRVHLYWYGYDRDGEVVRYRFAIDSDTLRSPVMWRATTAHDSTFIFQVAAGELVGTHVFWIVAEDNDGSFDPTPAKRLVSIRTMPPSAWFTTGPVNFQYTGFDVNYAWTGSDPDGARFGSPSLPDSLLHASVPDSFEYLMLLPGRALNDEHPALPSFTLDAYGTLINEAKGSTLQPPHEDWKWVRTGASSHRFTSLPLGIVVVAVRAVDVAGAKDTLLTFGRNIRVFTVGSPPTP